MLVQSLGQEDPLEEGMATHSCVLAGKSQRQRSLAGYSPDGRIELHETEVTQHALVIVPQSGHLCRQHCSSLGKLAHRTLLWTLPPNLIPLSHPWDFFGRNDAKAEAPVLWTPHVKS